MPGGLLAVLDDVAVIARSAAASIDDVGMLAGKTSMKAAGVVVDDAAVTPQYVSGVSPARELPMIWKITKGSLRNKLIIILPIALLLSWLAPWALTPILMCGGAFLCFEGAEKILHKLLPHDEHAEEEQVIDETPEEAEKRLVNSAITTDLILSAEIMVISLNEIAAESFWMRAAVLIAVGVGITFVVYGAVGLLVKIDDIGLKMTEKNPSSKLGPALVKGMPYVLSAIGIIGTAAMLWVGGHIVYNGLHEFGINQPYQFIHDMAAAVPAGVVAWLVDTALAMVVGFIVGLVVVGVVKLIAPLLPKKSPESSAAA